MGISLLNKKFWAAALERAVRTFAQVLLTLIGVDLVDITQLDWPHILGVSATVAVVSLLTSVVNALGMQEPNAGIFEWPRGAVSAVASVASLPPQRATLYNDVPRSGPDTPDSSKPKD